MKDHTDNKNQGTEGAWSREHGGFKKKNNNKYRKSELNTVGEFFKGLGFSIGPHNPELSRKQMTG